MANIILPQVNILSEINDSTKLMVEQDGQINRYPIADLELGGGDVTIDLSNSGNAEEAVGINAASLGGYPAEDYAKVSDLNDMLEIDLYGASAAEPNLVDADTFGGRSPEEYNNYIHEQVRKAMQQNLLDNSDFTNPVNQRGQTSYTENGYTIDRWKNARCTVSLTDDGISFAWNGSTNSFGWFAQPLRDLSLIGKTVTIATLIDDTLYVGSCVAPESGTTMVYADDTKKVYIECINSIINVGIRNYTTTNITVKWMALYEGEYTINTLPMYQPKGYGVEVVNCNNGALAMELLWENASPASDFAAQTIALDLSQIDVVKVVYKVMTTSDNEYTFEASVNRSATIIDFVNTSYSSTTQVSSRDLTINPNGIIFKDSLNKQITSSSAASTLNSRLIPIKIYGVKGVAV